MRRFLLVAPVGLALFIPAFLSAQNEHLIQRMDDAQDAKDDLRDAVKAKDAAKAIAAVDKITGILQETKNFWADQKMADVVKMADDALAAAGEVKEAARAGNMDDAPAAYKKLDTACQQCHDVHPENRLKK
jgi:hypothetical protein